MIKLMTVVGARPQFVKAGVLSSALAKAGGVKEILVHSGQHYDANLSEVFFKDMNLPAPAYNLAVGSSSNTQQTAEIMRGLDELLECERPDGVLVFGDTNTTLAAALASAQRGCWLGHVEAGLRSYNPAMAEELNRRVTDHLSQRLYVPGGEAKANLQREGIASHSIVNVGDIMFDAVLAHKANARLPEAVSASSRFVLLTLHRAENVDDHPRLESILKLLEQLAEAVHIVCPLHPRTRRNLEQAGLLQRWLAAVQTLEPQGYLHILGLIGAAELVLTDSGGLQKEAFYLETPCRTLRTETEWTELVEAGWNALLEPDATRAVESLLAAAGQRGDKVQPYGSGNTAELIVQDVMQCVA